MEQMVANDVRNFCSENGYDYRDDYSGRGMYGAECVGIVGNADDILFNLGGFAEQNDLEIPNWDRDSMGLSSIIYFPSITIN